MNLETPPGYQNAETPRELKNALFTAQAVLKGRSPLPEEEWEGQYAVKFRKLFDSSDEFRDLLLLEMDNQTLRSLQDMLDKEE